LLKHWRQYIRAQPSDLQLLLIGPGEVANLPPQTHDLGFVSPQDKYDAMAAATLFVQPSPNESFSLVLMESWLAGTPALVNGKTEVLREHCVRSNGGLWWENGAEFRATLNYLLANPDQAAQMAAHGRHYVLENYRWETIIEKYVRLIEQMG
jgi:glycosyltransferase involved in cell wall biosynthesis